MAIPQGAGVTHTKENQSRQRGWEQKKGKVWARPSLVEKWNFIPSDKAKGQETQIISQYFMKALGIALYHFRGS